MAVIINRVKREIVGVAKAKILSSDEWDIVEYGVNLDEQPELINDKGYVYISEVDVHPNYMGKGFCKQLVTYLMNQVSALSPDYTHFFIENASKTGGGIPACICYVKSGTENMYDVYYYNKNLQSLKTMSPQLCVESDEDTRYSIPASYFYVKKQVKGGKRKKKTRTRRKKTRNKTRKKKEKNN